MIYVGGALQSFVYVKCVPLDDVFGEGDRGVSVDGDLETKTDEKEPAVERKGG